MHVEAMNVRPYERRWSALLVLCLSLVIIGMDNTILNVALPTLARDLGASVSELQWIVDAYILVFAGLLLTMGAVGDRFGRKLALNIGLVVFAAGSVASAFAGSAEVLIASRAAMGIGGALIMPATLSIITNVFPPHERGRAIGMWAGVAGMGIVLGPVIGGWLLEHFWWGSVFLVNVPIVAVAILAGWPLVPASRDPKATPLDTVGAGLSIVALAILVYGIIEAPENGWTAPLTLSAFAIAAILFLALVWWERRVEHPMLRMDFFRNPRFSAASAAITLVFFALFGSVFLLTQHLQFVLGYSPLQAGLRVLPVATVVVAAPLSARLVEVIGTKIVVAAGLFIVGAALTLLSTVDVQSGYGLVAASIAGLGTGMGFTMAPATESIMGSLPLAKAGVGSAMNDTTRQVGGALGVAVLGSILASSYGAAIQPALQGLPPQLAQGAGDSIGAAQMVAAQLGCKGRRWRKGRARRSSTGWATRCCSAPALLRWEPCWSSCSSLPEPGLAPRLRRRWRLPRGGAWKPEDALHNHWASLRLRSMGRLAGLWTTFWSADGAGEPDGTTYSRLERILCGWNWRPHPHRGHRCLLRGHEADDQIVTDRPRIRQGDKGRVPAPYLRIGENRADQGGSSASNVDGAGRHTSANYGESWRLGAAATNSPPGRSTRCAPLIAASGWARW
jgi:EmrB/QacA subfamily drug resistance transporter